MPRAEALRRTRDRARRSLEARNSLSTWKVSRTTGEGATDPDTGDWVPATVVVWTGGGHFRSAGRPFVRVRSDVGLVVDEPSLCVDAEAPRFRKGDTVEALQVDDESLLGRVWRIAGEPGSSYAVDREYPLEEVTDAR